MNKDTAGKAVKVKPDPNSQRAEQFPAPIANKDQRTEAVTVS